jgi:hypothetical protein
MSWNPQKSPGWLPNQEEMRNMSSHALATAHQLEKIDHCAGKLLGQLTFVFTGGVRSPSKGTYDKEPTQTEQMPKNVNLGSMNFGIYEWASNKGKEYQMISLEVFD